MRMIIFPRIAVLLTAPILIAGLSASVYAQNQTPSKRVYCWTENGRQVCGDSLPASAASNARTEYSSKTGNAVRKVDRTLSGSELVAAEKAAKAEADARDKEKAAQLKALAMIETYANENELRSAYGERLDVIKDAIVITDTSLKSTRTNLVALLRQATQLELNAAAVNKPLADKIKLRRQDIAQLQHTRETQLNDLQLVEAELENSLTRYRETKAELEEKKNQ